MRAFCCQFGLGIEGLRELAALCTVCVHSAASSAWGSKGLRELAALCTVCVHSAADSGD